MEERRMVESKENHFDGFSAETVFFLKNLKENNNREWFLARKKDYRKKVVQPASLFVVEMGEMLKKVSPEISADPRVSRSICRNYQDTRNSHQEEPYKPYLGIWFWFGERKTHESPGYYFELKPDSLYLSAGNKVFSRKALHSYREAVNQPESGNQLLKIVEKLKEKPEYQLSQSYYKGIPEGYKVDEQRTELIRFNGLMVSTQMAIPSELYNHNLLKFVFQIYKDFSQLENWLHQHVYHIPKEQIDKTNQKD